MAETARAVAATASPAQPLEPHEARVVPPRAPGSIRGRGDGSLGIQPPDAPHGRVLRRERSVERHALRTNPPLRPEAPAPLCAGAPTHTASARSRAASSARRVKTAAPTQPERLRGGTREIERDVREVFGAFLVSVFSVSRRLLGVWSSYSRRRRAHERRNQRRSPSVSQLVLAAIFRRLCFFAFAEFGERRAPARRTRPTQDAPTSSVATFESKPNASFPSSSSSAPRSSASSARWRTSAARVFRFQQWTPYFVSRRAWSASRGL